MLTGVVTSLIRWGRYFLRFPGGKTNSHRARSPLSTQMVRWFICLQLSLGRKTCGEFLNAAESLWRSIIVLNARIPRLELCSAGQLTAGIRGDYFPPFCGLVINFLHCYSSMFPDQLFYGLNFYNGTCFCVCFILFF